MIESDDPKYFVDGFFIKHFKIFPEGCDPNNLFYEQKRFILYLIGKIPSFDDWSLQVEYQTALEEIKRISSIKLSEADIDLANIQGKDIEEIKKERLLNEKQRRIHELNKSYGIKEEIQEIQQPENIPENDVNRKQIRQDKLWDLLQGKGIIKQNGE